MVRVVQSCILCMWRFNIEGVVFKRKFIIHRNEVIKGKADISDGLGGLLLTEYLG